MLNAPTLKYAKGHYKTHTMYTNIPIETFRAAITNNIPLRSKKWGFAKTASYVAVVIATVGVVASCGVIAEGSNIFGCSLLLINSVSLYMNSYSFANS